MVMDADSTLSPDFLQRCRSALLEADPDLVAVGGLFYGEDGGRLVGQFQRNEYTRYQRLVARKLGRVFVLTGTASVIRAYALRAVAEARGPCCRDRREGLRHARADRGQRAHLGVEDLGSADDVAAGVSGDDRIMTSWRDLWRQRLRWHRGALENIAAYGLTRATAMYWGQQLALAYGVVALQSYFVLMTVSLLAADSIRWSPFWMAIGLIFLVERLVTVWQVGMEGPRGRCADLPRARLRRVPPGLLRDVVRVRSCSAARRTGTTSRGRRSRDWSCPAGGLGPSPPGASLLPATVLHSRLVHRSRTVGRLQHPRLRLPERSAAPAPVAPPRTPLTASPHAPKRCSGPSTTASGP